jgi:uncharacterized membrane protein YidH (DUF202 family)
MQEPTDSNKPANIPNRRAHMANERTFLAWIRTSIGIMAFGFVVEKFALFIRQFSYFIDKGAPQAATPSSFGFSSIFGILLVVMGGFIGVLAFVRYKKVEKEINENTYQPSIILDLLVTMGIITIGIFLVFYMMHAVGN